MNWVKNYITNYIFKIQKPKFKKQQKYKYILGLQVFKNT